MTNATVDDMIMYVECLRAHMPIKAPHSPIRGPKRPQGYCGPGGGDEGQKPHLHPARPGAFACGGGYDMPHTPHSPFRIMDRYWTFFYWPYFFRHFTN